MPKLVIFRGDAVENETRLAGRLVRLGRDSRNDIVLDDKSVSRFHAEVRPEGDKYFIVDLKSRNGVWVSGQQVKGKTELALGSPVTLGAFELTLEDDVPTGEFDEAAPLLAPRTVVSTPLTDHSDQASRSATHASMKAPAATTKRQVVLWSAAGLAVVLLCGVTYAVIRYRGRPATIVEVATPPPVPEAPAIKTPIPAEPPAEDPIKVTIDRHLADAQTAIGSGDYDTARDHLARVLELDRTNKAAVDLKRQVDAGSRTAKPAQVAVATPPPPTLEVEKEGIPRRTGETWADYLARVARISVNLETGKNYVEKRDFANALARFRLVASDQRGYPGIDALIVDALAKQQKALEDAMNSARLNEDAGRLRIARQWYQRAMEVDPGNSAAARDKNTALFNRMAPEANKQLNAAAFAVKSGQTDKAIEIYQQILDMMLPGDEVRENAVKELGKLKR